MRADWVELNKTLNLNTKCTHQVREVFPGWEVRVKGIDQPLWLFCFKQSANMAINRTELDSHFNLNQLRARLCEAVIECFDKRLNAVDFEALNPMGFGHRDPIQGG